MYTKYNLEEYFFSIKKKKFHWCDIGLEKKRGKTIQQKQKSQHVNFNKANFCGKLESSINSTQETANSKVHVLG